MHSADPGPSATPRSTPPATRRASPLRLVVFFGGALVIIALDQATKALVRDRLALGAEWPAGWDLIHLTHVENAGAAFGILQGAWIFLLLSSVIAIAAVIVFIFWAPAQSRLYTLAFTLVLGGALGNFIDRATRVTVTDFIKPTHYPAFNVADSSIVIGVTVLIVLSFLEDRRSGRGRARRRPHRGARVIPKRHFAAGDDARLDVAIVSAMPELSRSQVRRLIEDGQVTVDGRIVERPAAHVAPTAQIEVVEPVVPDLDLQASEVPLDIIYEDEETLVLNKQPGLVVHPRPGMNAVTLINAVRAHYPEVREIDDSERGGIVHRLDRDTSGVIALAKSDAAQYAMKEQWRVRATLKIYLGIVEGRMEPPEGIIDAPLGPDPTEPTRRAVVERGQAARTQYRVLEQYGDEAALLEVRIFTGRTHQIRVHMEAIGHPIIGDQMYGRPSDLIDRQALHATRLGFTLASNGAWREFEAPLPNDMRRAVAILRARHGVAPSEGLGACDDGAAAVDGGSSRA